MIEQKVEKLWYLNQNRLLAEKRRDEELKQHMKEWSSAKERLEAQIQRKKEHQSFGTNFEKARGFVRTNWESKNFNPKNNPLSEESSTDEDEHEDKKETEIVQEESKKMEQLD